MEHGRTPAESFFRGGVFARRDPGLSNEDEESLVLADGLQRAENQQTSPAANWLQVMIVSVICPTPKLQ